MEIFQNDFDKLLMVTRWITSRMLSEPINPTMLNGYLFFTMKSNGTLDSDQICDLNKSDVESISFYGEKETNQY